MDREPTPGDVWMIRGQPGYIDSIDGSTLLICHASQDGDKWRPANIHEVGAHVLWLAEISKTDFAKLSQEGEFLGNWPRT
jgi:hypothetical protein